MITTTEYNNALQPLRDARENRLRRVSPVEMIDQAKLGGPDKTGIGNEGTLVLVLSRNQKAHDRAMKAITEGGDASRQFVKRIDEQMRGIKLPETLEDVFLEVQDGVPIAVIIHGGCPIVDPIWFPPGLDSTLIGIPYNGGRLAKSGFQIVNYINGEADEFICGTVLRHPPKLSLAEKEAISKVPADLSTIHLGNGYSCEYTTVAAATGAVIGAAVGAAGGPAGAVAGAVVAGLVGGLVDAAVVHMLGGKVAKLDVHISEGQISKLGPALSAKTLVNLRREALLDLSAKARKR